MRLRSCIRNLTTVISILLLAISFIPAPSLAESPQTLPQDSAPDDSKSEARFDEIRSFLLLLTDGENRDEALETIRTTWKPSYAPMIIEILSLSRNFDLVRQLIELLEAETDAELGYNLDLWYDWMWNQDPQLHPFYADFKGILYSFIDPRFEEYFSALRTSKIRLDEVRWGGVLQDGIPPLRSPKMISAQEADYLEDSNIVFGLEVNGDARAYPKRIMAWHEMFVDNVGETPVAGVYCTLCGSMILYKTTFNGVEHEVGTSGFLYRSNKLMYDKKTQSLWNTLWGTPVIGPLADEDIMLERLSIVTTTWGAWKERHPDTQVLSLDTGHRRDYSEGAAYRDYFATDELMFTVPKQDNRLKNKDEVLGLVFSQHADKPLAIASSYLAETPIYHDRVESLPFVVLTDKSGAHRVYETQGRTFQTWDQQKSVIDDKGTRWSLSEGQLTSAGGDVLNRLPAHRAFWFGWYSAYSHTRLIPSDLQ